MVVIALYVRVLRTHLVEGTLPEVELVREHVRLSNERERLVLVPLLREFEGELDTSPGRQPLK